MEASAFPASIDDDAGDGAEEVCGGVGEDGGVKSEEVDRNFARNRWPREETLALLQIRSEMDVAFRDSSAKGPLWEKVSRDLAELGYNRTAKKCKEKFENICKYHRRTKEGRSGRSNGKMYRFFEQLEALDSHHPSLPQAPFSEAMDTLMTRAAPIEPVSVIRDAIPFSMHNPIPNFSDSSTSTSSSTKEFDGKRKKRKFEEYFERLMRQVMERQENLQKKFVEVMEKCEQDSIAREEAWKNEELARIKRERELLAQERSVSAAKDAAVLSFLQKFAEQQGLVQLPKNPIPVDKVAERQDNSYAGESVLHATSSRWPKEEVDALIRIRTNLDFQYQDNASKGPVWEEVSAAMKKLGYDRSAKRCKEKWENMNKYFKRLKEGNKKRPQDSNTCPYFQQLEALHKGKTRKVDSSSNSSGFEMRTEELLMHMIGSQEQQRPDSIAQDGESENTEQNHEENRKSVEEEGDAYQIAANNHSPMAIIGS